MFQENSRCVHACLPYLVAVGYRQLFPDVTFYESNKTNLASLTTALNTSEHYQLLIINTIMLNKKRNVLQNLQYIYIIVNAPQITLQEHQDVRNRRKTGLTIYQNGIRQPEIPASITVIVAFCAFTIILEWVMKGSLGSFWVSI